MDKKIETKSLPEKVVRRHAEFIEELLPELTRLVIEEHRPVDALLNKHLRAHRELGSRDRRFLSQAIFSYFRWFGWTVKKLNLGVSEACLIGVALDSEEMTQSFQYIEKRCSLPFRIQPLGSKTVPEKCEALNQLFSESDREVATLKLEDLAFEDFASVVDPEKIEKCLIAFQQRPPVWMRLRGASPEVLSTLAENNVAAQAHPVAAEALSVDAGVSLQNILVKQSGQFAIQDIASQTVGLIADPQPGGDWWDCCAGAGGKAMHLMDLMKGDGKVLASDIRLPPLQELKKRARKYGIRKIRTQPFNAVTDAPFKKQFDGVLVDAPCSGWGTWNRNPDARWRASRRDVAQCSTRQLKILNNVKHCVKPDGLLIYAVCAFTRLETTDVVEKFLKANPNFVLEGFKNPLTGEPTEGHLQVWPWEGPGDGMFTARFRRASED